MKLDKKMRQMQSRVIAKVKDNLSNQRTFSTKKVLLLDDEPYNIEVLQSILQCLNLRGLPHSIESCFDA